MMMLERGKIDPWHQFIFYVVQCVIQGLQESVKVLFVQEYLMFFVAEALIVWIKSFLALGDCYIEVVGAGRFHIKEIRTLTRLHLLRVDFISSVGLILFHSSVNLV